MKKPTKGSSGCLTSEKLFDVLKTRDQWTSLELLNSLMSTYPGYDKEGLGHRIRQILSVYTKKGLLKRVEKGTYSVT
ncbi:MAG: hypothetical protein HZA82_06530 [Thaumarchaeota archaeon]|nr:hypothetical protein [Nitrososphaerota archaeon]